MINTGQTFNRRYLFVAKINVKEVREKKNYTLQQLSILSSVPKSTINKIENNGCSPTINTLEKIAIGLNAHITELFESDYK